MSEHKFSKRSVAKALRDTARVIEKYGFVKYVFGNENSGFCTLGAMRHAVPFRCDLPGEYDRSSDFRFVVRKQIQVALHKAFNTDSPNVTHIPTNNDRDGTTRDDILRALRREAAALEHGGELGYND
jgi:hypothetical protein